MKKLALMTLAAILSAPLLVGWTHGGGGRAVLDNPQTAVPAPDAGRYADVNGLKMYYEIHGDQGHGVPLLLIHGALGTIDMWGPILTELAKGRQVIAIEQQAHGHTADVDRPLTFEQMADDAAALLGQLNVAKADLFGYSMGGQVALAIAVRHPDLVRKLVFVGSAYNPGGWHPDVAKTIQGLKPEDLVPTPLYDAYVRAAPDPNGFATMIRKVQELERGFKGWSDEQIRAIKAPTLIAIGDSDGARLEHAVELFRLLGGGVPGDLTGLPNSRLAVLPGTTHVSLVLDHAPWLIAMTAEFLDAPMPAGG